MDLLRVLKAAYNSKINVTVYRVDEYSARKGFMISTGDRDHDDYDLLLVSDPKYYDGNHAETAGKKIAEDLQRLASDFHAADLL